MAKHASILFLWALINVLHLYVILLTCLFEVMNIFNILMRCYCSPGIRGLEVEFLVPAHKVWTHPAVLVTSEQNLNWANNTLAKDLNTQNLYWILFKDQLYTESTCKESLGCCSTVSIGQSRNPDLPGTEALQILLPPLPPAVKIKWLDALRHEPWAISKHAGWPKGPKGAGWASRKKKQMKKHFKIIWLVPCSLHRHQLQPKHLQQAFCQ